MAIAGLTALLAIIFLSLQSGSAFKFTNKQRELLVVRLKIKSIHRLLAAECGDIYKVKRAVDDAVVSYKVEIAERVYNELLRKLVECRKRNLTSPKLTTSSTTPKATVTPTPTSTNALPFPKQCETAKKI